MEHIHPLPNDAEVRQMLGMLFGDDLGVESTDAMTGNQVVAAYVNDDDQPVCACVCNYHCAAFMGSALTKIPPGGAEDAANSGDFSDMMVSNISETMNICSRLFMDADSPHLRLDKVYLNADEVPDPVREIVEGDTARVHFTVDVPNYGSGIIGMMST